MAALYDVTILLSIGLATVIGAVFAVTTTFLGKALSHARVEAIEEAALAAEEYTRVQEQVKAAQTLGGISKELSKALRKERRRRYGRAWRNLNSGPQLLGVTHSVVIPGLLFLASAALSGVAELNVPLAQEGWNLSWWWVAGVLSLTVGLWRLISVLKAVEAISGTSEEAYLQEQTEALRSALEEQAEREKPMFEFRPQSGRPARLVAGSINTVAFRTQVVSGSTASNIDIWLWIPSGFEFGDEVEGTDRNIPSPDSDYTAAGLLYEGLSLRREE